MTEPQQTPSAHSRELSSSIARGASDPEHLPAEPTPLVHRIFIGPSGLRVVWRLAIYIAAVVSLASVVLFIVGIVLPPSKALVPPVAGFLIGECVLFVSCILPALALARLEKRRFSDYGLPVERAFGKPFWVGAVWGVVAFSVLIFVMRGIGVFTFGGLALHGARLVKFAVFWALLFLLVGLFEEFTARGYTLFTLSQGIGFWPAAVLLSAAFGGIHLNNTGEAWAGAAGAASIGLFFCLTLRRTGTLWFAVGMHMSWDWSETYFYSVPDSGLVLPGHLLNSSFHGPVWLTGGSVGPEGSVLVFVLIGLIAVVFDRVYPGKKIEGIATVSNLPNA